MTFRDAIDLYEIQAGSEFWYEPSQVLSVVEGLDSRALFDYLFMEYYQMRTVDANSQDFHKRVVNFFMIHRWNIDKLMKSTQFQYDPITDHKNHQKLHRTLDRTTTDTIDDDWKEKGTTYQQDANLVSAYNDVESPQQAGTDENGNPIYRYIDTEHDRTISNGNYSKEGSDDRTDTGKLDDIIGETIDRHGTSDHTFQSLIEEERRQAEFNLYKWIARHFSRELLIGVW